MNQLELKLANSNSGSCRTIHRAQYSSSFLTAPVEKVYFRSVLMMSHTAHSRMTDSLLSSLVYLS